MRSTSFADTLSTLIVNAELLSELEQQRDRVFAGASIRERDDLEEKIEHHRARVLSSAKLLADLDATAANRNKGATRSRRGFDGALADREARV